MRLRPRRLSLRARLMLLGVTGVALALALGSIALYGVLAVAIGRTLDNEARATADQVATLVDQHQLPEPIPTSGTQMVQVLDAHNRVLGASVNADRLTAVLGPQEVARARSGDRLTVPGSRAGVEGPLRILARPAGSGRRPVTVVVAQQVGALTHSQALLRHVLVLTYPLLLAVLALIAWFVIGRALRPVDQLRIGADRISGTEREERLPVPEAADEIHALAVTLNGMLDRLSAVRGRQRTFVADAAHELRSPLASIRTQLEVAQRLGEGGTLADDLLVDVARLSSLVEDLLLLARADGKDRPAPPREAVAIQPLLEEVAGRYAGARVPVEVGDQPLPETAVAAANRQDLQRVLANLIDNAVRHATSVVRLASSVEDTSVLITVTDDGPGVPEADRERVFERFTRLDDARDRDAGGSGLGLAIVQELVSRLDGTVILDGADPARPGLTVRVRLPHGVGEDHRGGAAAPRRGRVRRAGSRWSP